MCKKEWKKTELEKGRILVKGTSAKFMSKQTRQWTKARVCASVCLQKTTTPTSSVLALSTLLCLAFSLCFCVWIDEGEAVLMWTCCHTLPKISHTDFWSVLHHPLQLALWFYFIFSFFLSLSSHIPPLSFQWCNAFFTFTQTHVHWLHILQQFFSTDPNKTTNLSSTQWIISIIAASLFSKIFWSQTYSDMKYTLLRSITCM